MASIKVYRVYVGMSTGNSKEDPLNYLIFTTFQMQIDLKYILIWYFYLKVSYDKIYD
jgi:hypothetical protein